MKKLFCSLLIIGCLGLIPIVNHVFAGEKANALVTTGPDLKLAYGVRAVTGSATFASGLGTVSAVVASGDAVGTDTGIVSGTSSGGNITLKAYGNGTTTTTLSTTATRVIWFAIGTP